MPGPVYLFGDFRLDCGAFQLFRKGHALRVERKPLELLILLVSNAGQVVPRAEIAQRLWSSEVFVDTEHGINTAIRKLRHALRDDSNEPQFVQTVTGIGYRFAGQVTVAEPPASVILDSRISGLKNEERDNATGSRWPHFWIGVSFLFAVLVVALFSRIGPHPFATRLFHRSGASHITSIAVLPLENLSGDRGQDYLADGMTDELITMMAKYSNLRVTSRTSVMQFKNAHTSLPEIARTLNVEGIVEGSVSHSSDHVHLTLQLIRAEDDSHLWAESYDRNIAEAASLPFVASRAIASSLGKDVLSASAKAAAINPGAHDAYLRGRYLWWSGKGDRGFSDFKKAIELQPDFALGWAWLANYYGAGMSTGTLDPRVVRDREIEAASKAVQLDDSEAEAHLALCGAFFLSQWNMERAEGECLRAIQLDPKYAEAYHFHSRILSSLGRNDEAVEAQRKATELDPTARPGAMPTALIRARRFDEAIEDARQRLNAYPNNEYLLWALLDAYRDKGMEKEEEDTIEKLFELAGDAQSAEAAHQLYVKGGRKAVLRWRVRQVEEQARKRYMPAVSIALLYAQLGDREKTLSLLEDGFEEHSPLLLALQLDPAYDFLHADPRYRSLVRKIGLPQGN